MKNIILFFLVFTTIASKAQTFAGIQFNSIGAGMQLGVQSKLNADNEGISGNAVIMTLGMNHPIRKNENPTLYYFTAELDRLLSYLQHPVSKPIFPLSYFS